MKFLSVRELRSNSAKIWKELPAVKEMVVTNNGHPVALITPVDEKNFDRDIAAWRQVRAARAVFELQRESVRKGLDTMSMDDIDVVIRKSRKDRRKRSA